MWYKQRKFGDNRRIKHGNSMAPEANSIPRNTLYVCIQNSPVVDFFIHDANVWELALLELFN